MEARALAVESGVRHPGDAPEHAGIGSGLLLSAQTVLDPTQDLLHDPDSDIVLQQVKRRPSLEPPHLRGTTIEWTG